MKSIIKIVTRYILYAALLCIIVLFFNIAVLIYCKIGYDTLEVDYTQPLEQIVDGFYEQNGTLLLNEDAAKILTKNYEFAMMIDNSGTVIWSEHLPEGMDRHYSMQDINAAAKWYLDDYPVRMWNNKYGIFVAGFPKNSVWKYGIEYSLKGMDAAIYALPIGNLVLLLCLCLFFGWRFYKALKPVAQGIETLSQLQKVELPERGILAELSRRINKTSEILTKQNELLAKRDDARTQWISGVSHDIRTPLSMIMGYADSLEQDKNLDEEHKMQAGIIRKQSQTIKELIEDLNMTSKLEYQMQPLYLEKIGVAKVIRDIVADYCNSNPDENYEINLDVESNAEKYERELDPKLLKRAISNLIGNSIRHNNSGCKIEITIYMKEEHCLIDYSDDGIGISEAVLKAFREEKQDVQQGANQPHILGLYLVRQIVNAHGGTFELFEHVGQGMKGRILL